MPCPLSITATQACNWLLRKRDRICWRSLYPYVGMHRVTHALTKSPDPLHLTAVKAMQVHVSNRDPHTRSTFAWIRSTATTAPAVETSPPSFIRTLTFTVLFKSLLFPIDARKRRHGVRGGHMLVMILFLFFDLFFKLLIYINVTPYDREVILFQFQVLCYPFSFRTPSSTNPGLGFRFPVFLETKAPQNFQEGWEDAC